MMWDLHVVILLTIMCPKHGLLPSSVANDLQEQTPNFHKWSEAVIASPSVTEIFNVDENVARTKERLAKARA